LVIRSDENLSTAYSDFASRLPRGRSYVRNGSVFDLQISEGKVQALVQGPSLYKISITFKRLPPNRWGDFKTRNAGKVTNLLDLLQGRLSKDILAEITAAQEGLFPSPQEIELDCSCPDWADMCKHVAAVLYGVGARLDEKPELFFTLRGVDLQELLQAASAAAAKPTIEVIESVALAGANLAEIFGVELESSVSEPTVEPKPAPPKKRKPKAKTKPPRKVQRR
jgi:uncharacterized Zn finger protein